MGYANDLQDGNWHRRRVEILTRDGFKCRLCPSTKHLEIHHVDYIDGIKTWDYPSDMLMTLCRKCHEKEVPRAKVERQLIDSLKMKGFMIGDVMCLGLKIDNDKKFTETLLKILREMQNG